MVARSQIAEPLISQSNVFETRRTRTFDMVPTADSVPPNVGLVVPYIVVVVQPVPASLLSVLLAVRQKVGHDSCVTVNNTVVL